MNQIVIRVGDRSYPVFLENGAVTGIGELVQKRLERTEVVVVADRRVAGLHGDALRQGLSAGGVRVRAWLDVPSGERAKSLPQARRLYQAFVAAEVDRGMPVLALGGGVVGDLCGFVASTFLRGLPLVQVPSTVIAQVDSAVGGKTAVNFSGAKNLIGTFHQPVLVVCDPLLLETLSPRDYRAGLAEAVKIGVTLRPDLLERMEEGVSAILRRDGDILTEVTTACVAAKGEVVGRDETDQDVRSVLNYGHTVGHALEAVGRGKLRHGEAVAVGMNAAAWIGEAMGVSVPQVRQRQNALLQRLGLKLTAPGADNQLIARNLRLDKKVRDRSLRFVLTLQIGGASVWPQISGGLLDDAVRYVTS